MDVDLQIEVENDCRHAKTDGFVGGRVWQQPVVDFGESIDLFLLFGTELCWYL